MAMFGFVYAWYLAVVLQVEIWLDYRRDFVRWAKESRGLKRAFYYALTLGATDVSPQALRFGRPRRTVHHAGRDPVGVPAPRIRRLHLRVDQGEPVWSSVLIPIVFLFSAMVSGIALVLVLYVFSSLVRSKPIDMVCLDKLASFLLYALIVDFSLEMLDFIHRLYEAEESIHILGSWSRAACS